MLLGGVLAAVVAWFGNWALTSTEARATRERFLKRRDAFHSRRTQLIAKLGADHTSAQALWGLIGQVLPDDVEEAQQTEPERVKAYVAEADRITRT